MRNAFSLYSHRTFLFSIHPFQHPEHSCICLPSLPQIPSSLPHLSWRLSCLKPALLKVQHPPSLKKNTPVPACQPSGWKPSGLLWGVGGVNTTLCFLSLHPTPRPWGKPSPSQFLPVSQARSVQDIQLPGVRVPHSSGFTPPHGGLQIPSWGGGGRARGLELKVHQGPIPAHCTLC